MDCFHEEERVKMKRLIPLLLSFVLIAGSVFQTPVFAASIDQPEEVSIEQEIETAEAVEAPEEVPEEEPDSEEEGTDPKTDLVVQWVTKDGAAYVVLSFSDKEESAGTLIPSVLELGKKLPETEETEEPGTEETDNNAGMEEEALYRIEGREEADGSVWYELPVYELDPDVYVLRSAPKDVLFVEQEFHIVSVFDSAQEPAVLEVTEDIFYVPYVKQEVEENPEPVDAEEEEIADEAGAADPASEETEGATSEDEDMPKEEESSEEADSETVGESAETAESAEESGGNEEAELLTSEPTGISLKFSENISDHKLYVELAGDSSAQADVWFVLSNSTYLSGQTQAVKKLEGCRNNSGNSIDLDSIKVPAGKWYLYAVILKPDADVEFSVTTIKLETETPMLFYVPTTPSPELIQPATKGSADGAFGMFNMSAIQYPDLSSQYGTPGSVRYGSADAAESSYTTAIPNMPVNNLSAGDYRIRFESQKLTVPVPGTMGTFAAASDYRTFTIPKKEPQVDSLRFWDGNESLIHYEMYKGQTRRLQILFMNNAHTVNPENEYVTYSSSDPARVSVDATGNIQAKKIVPATDYVTITATYGSIKRDLYVHVVEPLKIKTKKTAYTADRTSAVTIEFTIPKDAEYTASDFTVTSSDSAVWDCGTGKTADSLDPTSGIGTIVIPANSNRIPGTTTVTITSKLGEMAYCTVTFDGVYKPGTDEMLVYKGGKKQTGWIYLNNAQNAIVSKAQAEFIYYINPVNGGPVNHIVKIGKNLYGFYGYELVTGYEGRQPFPGKTYDVFFSKDGRLLTGWQGPAGDKRYYNPEYGWSEESTFIASGNGWAYVKSNGTRMMQGAIKILGKTYFFADGLLKTGWIYLDEASNPTTKKKAVSWFYADPGSGEVLLTLGIHVIGGKKYVLKNAASGYVRQAEHYDADINGSVSIGDYFTGPDGVVVTNKKYTYDGKTYYLGEDGHPKSGMFYDGSRVVMTNGNGEEVKYSSSYSGLEFYICKQDNTGSALAYAEQKAKGGIRFYDGETNTLKETWIRTKDVANKKKAGYYYIDKNGKLVKGFQTIDGNRYYFDENTGLLQVGEFKSGEIDTDKDIQIAVKGKYYLVDNTPIEGTGFPGRIYYKDAGLKGTGGYRYYVDANGVCQTGWKTDNGEKYYFYSDGTIHMFGDLLLNGKRYAINSDGSLRTPNLDILVKDGSDLVGVLRKDGTYKTGWFYTNSTGDSIVNKKTDTAWTYYVNPNGLRLKDPQKLYLIDGKYYAVYKDKDYNRIVHGDWIVMNNPEVEDVSTGTTLSKYTGEFLFYFDEKTGAAVSGKRDFCRKYYPLIKDGKVLLDAIGNIHKVKTDDTKEMFFRPTQCIDAPPCSLILNTNVSLDGGLYCLDQNGMLISGEEGWTDYAKTRYIKADGTFATGRTRIDSAWYYFDPADGTKQTSCVRRTGKKWYAYQGDGQQYCPVNYSDLLVFTDLNGKKTIYAEYDSDGSIKCFRYVADGKKVVNDGIVFPLGEVVIIGKNSLPQTGVVKNPRDSGGFYILADGKQFKSGFEYMLMKIGKKYYVCWDGQLMSVEYEQITKFDTSLSDTDRRILAMYKKIYEASGITEFYVSSGTDGSVLANAAGSYGDILNSYGAFLEYNGMVLFCKKAGKWCVPETTMPGARSVKLIGTNSFNATIRWKKNGVLEGIYDANGKALNGVFRYYAGVDPNEIQVEICLKNGMPVTGKQTITNDAGFKKVMYFDPDCGVRYDNVDPIL